MVSDDIYELCLPVLNDDSLDEDEKTEKLEELLRKETGLTGKSLENAVLDALWRSHDSGTSATSPPPSRHTVIRRSSPAPWQVGRAPTPSQPSPRMVNPPPGFGVAPPGFNRAKSSTASPFSSPRPSPRLGLATPHIPHSPNLDAYPVKDHPSPAPDIYGDLGSENVEWLVGDEVASVSSSFTGEGALNGAAAEWVQPINVDMSPYDMLRSILRDDRSDQELEKALEGNNYDLSATLVNLMEAQIAEQRSMMTEPERTLLIGKSMSPNFRPATPLSQKSTVICKYWLASGNCARADCRFSHDTSKTMCKYWMMGNCLAGETCVFSHDPSALMARMILESGASTPPTQTVQPNFQDYDSFPSLQPSGSHSSSMLGGGPGQFDPALLDQMFSNQGAIPTPPPGLSPAAAFVPHAAGGGSRSHSRPTSRHASRAPTPSFAGVNDDEAFPSLGAAAATASGAGGKPGKKHHGKRGGHGHGGHGPHHHKESPAPSSLADLVRMSPSPSPAQQHAQIARGKGGKAGSRNSGGAGGNMRENSDAARAIPAPEHIPWLETGDATNKAYLKARQEAFKHGGLRNKFLQSAAQAWNRNDSRAAKALSLRGQSENNLMREAHREAARHLYEERNKENGPNARELYVDLHGLHPEEAVSYLEDVLLKHQSSSRPLYAITGTGHHSKNGKDKVGKAVRAFLNEWRYAYREFSVPGDRGNVGGILGVDPSSWDRGLGEQRAAAAAAAAAERGAVEEEKGDGKIKIVRREDVGRETTAAGAGTPPRAPKKGS
ncbi:hypothetical protein BDY21DRAFT_281549 [Lineolata rhizophorae]|uniref:CCCH zinc finger and SMR domain-containing protein n=1 Tax=Lineolata rhizophorae TaxID=578093 RepID=A0A6A6P8S5_9PEZI|nr:hypothetical protein BDY21DRAFT_281549 [Lineolata rhizophorae]